MYIAIREAVLKSAGWPDIAAGMRELGLTAVELEFFRDYSVYRPDRWEKITFDPSRAAAVIGPLYRAAGLEICAFLLHNNFNTDDQAGEIGWVSDAVNTAGALGIPAVRIDAITRGEREEPFETRVDRFVTCMKQVLGNTRESGVQLGIENHGIQGNDPAFLKNVITRVGDPRLGVNMDTGNFYWAGLPLEEVYRVLEDIAPFTKHTHVKNIAYPEAERQRRREPGWEYKRYVSPIADGDIDHRRVVSILRAAGYDGPLTIEDECLHKYDEAGRRETIRQDVASLTGLVAGKKK